MANGHSSILLVLRDHDMINLMFALRPHGSQTPVAKRHKTTVTICLQKILVYIQFRVHQSCYRQLIALISSVLGHALEALFIVVCIWTMAHLPRVFGRNSLGILVLHRFVSVLDQRHLRFRAINVNSISGVFVQALLHLKLHGLL